MNYYGHHRFTGDIDFWIAVDVENAQRVSTALQQFGFSAKAVRPDIFTEPGRVHMFGREPVRVDLLTSPSGVEFEACYARRVMDTLDGVPISIISLADLRQNKLASGREKDLLDVKQLPSV